MFTQPIFAYVVGVFMGAIIMGFFFWRWEFRGRQKYLEFPQKSALIVAQNWMHDWDVATAQESVTDRAHVDLANRMIEIFDSGIAAGAGLKGSVTKFYRRQVDSAEAKAKSELHGFLEAKATWKDERQKLVNVRLAAKVFLKTGMGSDAAALKRALEEAGT